MAMSLDTMEMLNANVLAQMAQCGTPEPYSAGADFLYSVRDEVLGILSTAPMVPLTQDQVNHVLATVADQCPPTNTADTWATFDDLAAWAEDISEYVIAPAESLNMTTLANTTLYIIAGRLVWALAAAVRAA